MKSILELRIAKLELSMDLPAMMAECNEALQIAQISTKTLASNQGEIRQDELESRAATHALQGSADKQANVQAMNNKEQMSQIFSRIRSIQSDQSARSHFTSLQIPTSWPLPGDDITNVQALPDPKAIQSNESKWRTVEHPSKILYYLRLRNRLHFGQAQGTHFTVPPLSELIDWEARRNTLTYYSKKNTTKHH
jgi:hypothetical protein